MHKTIHLKDLALSFPHKTCFDNFNTLIPYGSRNAIIGQNGSGKTSLLRLIQTECPDISCGYVPQIVDDFDQLSGGERFQKALTQALSLQPDLLLLDEPTNHLDQDNRHALMRLLNKFEGTLIMVTHDVELLRHSAQIIWHIHDGQVSIFSGAYDDYQQERMRQEQILTRELTQLDRQKKTTHDTLMQEQKRSARSKSIGKKNVENGKWDSLTAKGKAQQAEKTSGIKKTAIKHQRQSVHEKLSELRMPEIRVPKFNLKTETKQNHVLVSITGGSAGYDNITVFNNLNLQLHNGERLAITGKNGSGKTTLVKAILGDPQIITAGEWHMPADIGYLDQHYATLDPHNTVFETIAALKPHDTHAEIRDFLNDFLFRKNEEVNALVSTLSGGEKARLCLAQIAALTPPLLILDEVTNNLDLETRAHMIQVLKAYPGALIIISHDADFLREINVSLMHEIVKWK